MPCTSTLAASPTAARLRQKVADTLRMIPRNELDEMSDDGAVTVTCEFCKSAYAFDAAQIDAVYAGGP